MVGEVQIDVERCKGCALCVSVCPAKILEIGQTANSKGYYSVEVIHPEKCTGCTVCAMMCPDLALEVFRFEPEKGSELS